MKKSLLCVLAVAAMASCSKNEVTLDATQKAIGFNGAQWSNSVVGRATSNLDQGVKLGVFAYQTAGSPSVLYINDELSYQNNTWKLSKTYYWPLSDSELAFFAYGPKADNNGIAEAACTVGGTPSFKYAVTGNPGSQTDVIVDLAGQKKTKEEVTFNLSHVLTQIKFKAQLSASPNTSLNVKVNSITVKAPASASFAISSGSPNIASWTDAASNTDYAALTSETAVTANNGSAAAIGADLNMIPGSGAEIVVVASAYHGTVKVGEKTITIKCNGASAAAVAAWVAGTQVTYTLTLDPDQIALGSGNAIIFGQPTVNNWGASTGDFSM